MITMVGAAASAVVAALAPLLIVVVGFDAFCLVDIARAEGATYLPRWTWAVLCVVISPLAGMVYLAIRRSR